MQGLSRQLHRLRAKPRAKAVVYKSLIPGLKGRTTNGPDEEQRLLVVLWAENFDRVESKESRVAWSEIAEKLNARFTSKSPLRTSESAKKKMKYLIDRYKKAKDWNKSHSGGNAKYPPFYKEIDEVLCNRDIVTLQHVAEAGCSASGESEGASTSDSQSSDNVANNQGRARWADEKKDKKEGCGRGARRRRKKASQSCRGRDGISAAGHGRICSNIYANSNRAIVHSSIYSVYTYRGLMH